MQKEEIVYQGKCNKCGEKHIASAGEQSVFKKNRVDPCPTCDGEITYPNIESQIYKDNKLQSKKVLKGIEINVENSMV